MSTRRANVADLDDAAFHARAELDDVAFRARLAPLSQAVLRGSGGQTPAAPRQSDPRPASQLAPAVRPGGGEAMPAAGIQDAYRSGRHPAPPDGAVAPGGSRAMPAAAVQHAYRSSLRRRGMTLAGITVAGIAVAAVLLMAGGAYVMLPSLGLRGANALPWAAAMDDAPASSAPASSAPSEAATPRDELVRILLQRGDAAIVAGDITAARLLYERAAEQGSAVAATDAAETYDPAFLREIDAHGIQADQAAAAGWYRKAAALGDAGARERLRRMTGQQPR
ncbi:MAG TPA: hypothetical protein VK741_13825 [Acetobacteraceae bacterium]|nr:hypothetical protein [Acetobacteraceae bacterium]